MTEMEFINLNVGIFKEILEDVPDEYMITVEDVPSFNIPVMNYDVEDEAKEFIIKPGNLNNDDDYQNYKEFVETTIANAIATERTQLGKNALKQLRINLMR